MRCRGRKPPKAGWIGRSKVVCLWGSVEPALVCTKKGEVSDKFWQGFKVRWERAREVRKTGLKTKSGLNWTGHFGVFTPLQRSGGEKACRSWNSLGTKRSGSVRLRIKHEWGKEGWRGVQGLVPAARVERETGGGETGVDSPCSLIRGQNID